MKYLLLFLFTSILLAADAPMVSIDAKGKASVSMSSVSDVAIQAAQISDAKQVDADNKLAATIARLKVSATTNQDIADILFLLKYLNKQLQ